MTFLFISFVEPYSRYLQIFDSSYLFVSVWPHHNNSGYRRIMYVCVEYWYLILLDSVSISYRYDIYWSMKKFVAEAREKRRWNSYMLYEFIRRGRVTLLLLVSLICNSSQRNIPIQNLEKVLGKGNSCSLLVSVWMSCNISMYSVV